MVNSFLAWIWVWGSMYKYAENNVFADESVSKSLCIFRVDAWMSLFKSLEFLNTNSSVQKPFQRHVLE